MPNPERNSSPTSTVAARATPRWSIVVPCYSSGSWLRDLVARIEAAVGPRIDDVELVLVDDASPDDETWPAIRACAETRPWVHGIGLQYNVGQFRALIAGLEKAHGDWVVTMDDDFQTPPEELERFFAAAEAHPEMDAIIGRYPDKHHSPFRNLGTRFVSLLLRKIYGKPADLQTSSFRILKRPLVRAICAHRTREPIFSALVLQSSRRTMNIEVRHASRAHGDSGYTLGTLIEICVAKIFKASTAPLRLVSILGLSVSFASLAIGAFYLVQWWRGLVLEPGFTALALLITALCGLILLAISVIGEYLIRVVLEVSGAPRYVIRAEAGNNETDHGG